MPDEPTRGERNHNPCNCERSTIQWAGMAKDQSSDDRFCVMESDFWGIRMAAMILLHGYLREDRHTVPQIIEAWAPPFENDTEAYVEDVCKWIGAKPDEILLLGQPTVLKALVTAIIHQENGRNPYPDSVIVSACNAALKDNKLML